jgi:transglutaminase-like putative cysteine protease
MLAAMARRKNWTVLLSIWGILAQMVSLVFAAELPAQLKTGVPPGAWVRECSWSTPTNSTPEDKSEGAHFLLFERQENPAENERFVHIVRLMENTTGVQDSGSLSFDFDPSFQEFILHRVRIHRDGKVLDKLDPAKIRIIQPESQLGRDVFTGKHSVVLFVEDLRVGDALEYAYTTRGANPVLAGHYASSVMVQSSVPVDRQRIRVVWTLPRPLFIQENSVTVPVKKAPWGGGTEYVWDFSTLEEIPYEDDLPFELDPYPSLEFTDFSDWAQVVNWALPLYEVEKTNPPVELEKLIATWRTAVSDEARARTALEFVQDELRYTGLELGPDSYRPAHPYETFRLRYGDCKGKASLLCTMLRAMNIEAYPALVESGGGMIRDGKLTSPFAFDHAIVKITLGEKVIWVDPTASRQGGLLWDRHVSHFGNALVVQPGVTRLEQIPYPSPDAAGQEITSTYQLKDYTSPASLTVKTVFRGGDADDNRAYFASNNRKEIQKNYLNFYSRLYAGITESAAVEVEDARALNLRTVTEHYQIPNFWSTNAAQKHYEANFHADALYSRLSDPQVRVRKMPLFIPHPLKVEQNVIIHLPDSEWNLPNTNRNLANEAFAFHFERNFSGAKVQLHYTLETLTNQIPAVKVATYLKDRETVTDELDTMLFRSFNTRSAGGGVNWLMVVVATFAWMGTLTVSVAIWLLTRVRVASGGTATPPPFHYETELQGLGGWLVLVGLGICLGPILRVSTLVSHWQGFFSQASWQAIAVPSGANYHPLYGPLLIFEVLTNVALLGLNLLLLCLFFAKRRAFPNVYMMFLIFSFTSVLIDEILSNFIPAVANHGGVSSPMLLRHGVATMLWCAYMLKSRRVKATFVK